MAEIINMPRLSDTMEEGTVAKWLKQVGDKIEEGDILAEIETDKATMEFESFYEGTLLHIGIEEGDGAPVDSLLAIIGEDGEDISGFLNGGNTSDAPAVEESTPNEIETPDTGVPSAPAVEAVAIPEGVEIIKMPRLSDTMEEGTVASWLKNVGEKVEEGDILAEIETDKATMEFESFYEGTLLYIGIQEGESALVDSILAVIGPEGTNVEQVLSNGNAIVSDTAPETTKDVPAAKEPTVNNTAETVATVVTDGKRIFASPLAKKIASDKGIALSDIKGSGDFGRIVKKDVENYVPSQKETATVLETGAVTEKETKTVPVAPVFVGEESSEEVKNSSMRKAITKSLSNSKFTAPHYYLTIEVDMDNAKASRVQINGLPDIKISFNDMIVKACAMALKKHPQVNTTWTGETTTYHHHINIGVAVAVNDGLVVPVVKFTDQLGLSQIGATIKDLAVRARNKKLGLDEMQGSTFTVSNLGMFGILEFTSIINQPNSAILSVGAIVEKPVVRNGEIVVGNTMKLTLACDHRTVDGATGAQFLQTLRSYIENPVTMLA